ncbi:MAG TPA: hypothetical protein VKR82_12590 [Candidatus Acidoferrales bacterium]|nr:hypothetical protein [Candidatus Acidoferrales bacterium]
MATQPPNPESTADKSASARLDSWKEIASYLKRDIRTVQRWEVSEGLPIHRHQHRKQGAVYAYASELDSWWHNHDAEIRASKASEENSPESNENSATTVLNTEITQSLGLAFNKISIRGRVAILGLGLAIAGFATWRLVRDPQPRVMTSIVLTGNKLLAVGDNGSILWSYSYAQPPKNILGSEILPQGFCGNGGADALVSVLWEAENTDELECFTGSGAMVWHFRLDESYSCRGANFGPPWHVSTWGIFRTGRETRLAVALHHDKWWPGVIATLDSKGQVLERFFNAGWITYLHGFENSRGRYLVAGGTSNSQDAAVMAVFDANAVGGSSPEQSGSQYDCSSNFTGEPLKYYVFPRTELNKVTGAERNWTDLDITGGQLFARTRENSSAGHFSALEVLYGFSDTFELTSATFGDRYWDIHAELEKSGVLKHSRPQCPDRYGPRLVSMWDFENGWKDLHPH